MGSTALFLVKLFAPNAEQLYIVNHLKGSPTEEKRNVPKESARRAHGGLQDLADLNSSKLEAAITPVVLGWPRTALSTVL
ncbi:putative glutamine amidotransferase-like class 1 domain-containing protein 3B, mitochondrial [Panthera onca]